VPKQAEAEVVTGGSYANLRWRAHAHDKHAHMGEAVKLAFGKAVSHA
jgi:hypothetical protein